MNDHRRYRQIGGLLAILAFSPATAEERARAVLGTVIRVTAPTISPAPLVGTLIESTDAGLLLAGSEAGSRTIPHSAITKVEWRSGRRSQAGRFAKIGAIALGGIAALAGALVYNDGASERAAGAALVGAGGALWGGIGGAVIGAFRHTYDWKEGPTPGRRVWVAPLITPGWGAGISVAYNW